PAAYLGVDFLGEAGQVRATAAVEGPGPDLLAFRLLRLAADGRGEASEIASWPLGKAAPEGVAEEVEAGVLEVSPAVRVLAVHDLRLHGGQLKTQGPEPLSDGGPQHPGLLLGVAVRNNVIRVTLERAARELPVHPRVERIVHEQISQDGRNGGTLRGPFLPRDNGPVRHLHRRYQPPGDVQQDPPLAGVVSYRLQQQGMRNGVEKGPDIKVQNPVLLPAPPTAPGQRIMGASPRTITVAAGVEDRLQFLFQQHGRRGLRYPVGRIRHAEQAHAFPMIFRYLHAPHRPREITARGHPVPQLLQIVFQLLFEQPDAHLVHARRPLVGPDLLPRPVNEALTDLKRLHLRPGFLPRLLPCRVALRMPLVCTAPSLQPHYRPFLTTTSRPVPVPRLGTLPLAVSAACGPPSRGQGNLPRPPVSGRQVLLFHASARDELTPPLHRTPPGQHAGRPLAEG